VYNNELGDFPGWLVQNEAKMILQGVRISTQDRNLDGAGLTLESILWEGSEARGLSKTWRSYKRHQGQPGGYKLPRTDPQSL
jgi:hypothetical protein